MNDTIEKLVKPHATWEIWNLSSTLFYDINELSYQ